MTRSSYCRPYAIGIAGLSITSTVPHSLAAQDNTPPNYEAPAFFQAAGPTTSSIAKTIDDFRLALGARREINWDAGGSDTTISGTPLTNFVNSRVALFTTPGSGQPQGKHVRRVLRSQRTTHFQQHGAGVAWHSNFFVLWCAVQRRSDCIRAHYDR